MAEKSNSTSCKGIILGKNNESGLVLFDRWESKGDANLTIGKPGIGKKYIVK